MTSVYFARLEADARPTLGNDGYAAAAARDGEAMESYNIVDLALSLPAADLG